MTAESSLILRGVVFTCVYGMMRHAMTTTPDASPTGKIPRGDQPRAFIGGQAWPLTHIALGLAHPPTQDFDRAAIFSATDRIAAHCDGWSLG
jgi:hypothetical protein